MFEKSLPIGSVVLIKNGNKRAMIVGYYQYKDGDTSKIYDYVGVGFPEGYLRSDALALFDHQDIENIYSIGYQDAGWQAFRNKLKLAIEASEAERV